MKQICLLFIWMLTCVGANAQTVGTTISVGHLTLSSGTEVSASCKQNDKVLEVQVEGNTDYLEVYVIKDGELEDYDVTTMTDDTMTFVLTDSEEGEYTIYIRSKEDDGNISIDTNK